MTKKDEFFQLEFNCVFVKLTKKGERIDLIHRLFTIDKKIQSNTHNLNKTGFKNLISLLKL